MTSFTEKIIVNFVLSLQYIMMFCLIMIILCVVQFSRIDFGRKIPRRLDDAKSFQYRVP